MREKYSRSRTTATPADEPSWLAVTNGQICIGHIICRGKLGWQAFNIDDEAIGFYPTQAAAADALERPGDGTIPFDRGRRR